MGYKYFWFAILQQQNPISCSFLVQLYPVYRMATHISMVSVNIMGKNKVGFISYIETENPVVMDKKTQIE